MQPGCGPGQAVGPGRSTVIDVGSCTGTVQHVALYFIDDTWTTITHGRGMYHLGRPSFKADKWLRSG